MTDLSSPCILSASSPDWKRRKKPGGSFNSRPKRAACPRRFPIAVRRSTARARTVVSAAVVKPATSTTWVTVASPLRSRMGMRSWNMVSVTMGVSRGISPIKSPAKMTAFQSVCQVWRAIKRRKSSRPIFLSGSPG